ncbi:MAG TPA: NAD-dependent epimerase/dehydratase family protein [Candidatus Saccharimonadia bacterium]|nr:NAD-dependent epimerase/dehydratase family protein [Candidatus Saccharimonadia bacterium]
MHVCVIGGTGHISTSIVRVLLEQGHEVTCVNRGLRGEVAPGARLVRGDRRERAAFERTLQAERFDAVIDMLCFTRADARSSVRAYRDVPHVVQCSTVCTYGITYDWLPVTEDHPLRPLTPYGQHKVAADATLLEAYERAGFPVTILKPSTTYGPMQGMLRQIAWEFAWIDRIRQGKPIVVCGQGNALHQHLHVEDAARGFVQVLGKAQCLGQTYNLVSEPPITWAAYHRTAMQVLGRHVELVGVALADLQAHNVPRREICQEIFAHDTYYSAAKLRRDVPEFHPVVSLATGMRQVFEAMEREGRIPLADGEAWEDHLIAWQTQQAQGTG